MISPNLKLKYYARSRDVYLWQIAEHLNVSEATLSRMLRRQLSKAETEQLRTAIDELSRKRRKYNNECS